MPVVFFDGFEDGFQIVSSYGWTTAFDSNDIDVAFKRSGSYGARIDSSKLLFLPNTSIYKQVVLGFAFKALNSNTVYIMLDTLTADRSAAQEMTSFMINSSTKTLGVGTGYQLATTRAIYDASALDFGQWHYYELRAYLDSTNGSLEMYLDGTRIINWVGNTLAAFPTNTTGFFSHCRINGTANAFDDIYLSASVTPSTANTEILGDVRVDRLNINGSGTFNDYIQDVNGNWNIVSDNSASTYVTASGIGVKETYNIGSLPDINATLHAIKVGGSAQKTSIGNRNIRPIVYISGNVVDTNQPTYLGYGGDTYFAGFYTTNPVTSQRWTSNDIDVLEVGTLVSGVI